MSIINNRDVVKNQYKNSTNLNTRISIHSKYSVNKMGFGNWIVSKYEIKEGARILELGCGTGDMWKEHIDLLDNVSELVLTDFSEGMLQSAKDMLGENEQIVYKVVDIQDIPYEDNSFDIVIANMMLYHVPDIHKGLSEVRRVLKEDGTFYCATYGENGIVEYISTLLKSYNVEGKLNKNFTLQNGKEILSNHFRTVTRYDYEDALEVTDEEDMIDYIYSLSSMSNINNIERTELKRIFRDNMRDGILYVPKEYGMFMCKNTYTYKKATIADIDELVKTRIMVLRAANKLSDDIDMSMVEKESYEYYKCALENGTHIAYLVYNNDEFIGAGGVSFYQVMPTYHNPSGRKAYIMNMYTKLEYRRQGIAMHTLDLLVNEAKNKGVNQISLEATEAGRPLYEKYGFVQMQDEMELA